MSEQIPGTDCSCETSKRLQHRIAALDHQILKNAEMHAAQLASLRQEIRELRQNRAEDTRVYESQIPTPQSTAGPSGLPNSPEEMALRPIQGIPARYSPSSMPVWGPSQDVQPLRFSSLKIRFFEPNEPYYCLTNYSPHQVNYKGKVYPTGQHLYQALKVSRQKRKDEVDLS